jgi:hypothetical protein
VLKLTGRAAVQLNDFFYFVGTEAARAHFQCFHRCSNFHFRFVKIRLPSAICNIMSMADVVPFQRSFSANITSVSHSNYLLKSRLSSALEYVFWGTQNIAQSAYPGKLILKSLHQKRSFLPHFPGPEASP